MGDAAEVRLGAGAAVDGARLDRLVDAVERVFHGHREVVRLAAAALLAHGHILFEDVPGVGKTTLARALAAATGLGFRRIQFTSDLLPSDVLGVSIFNPETRQFETRPGPIFTNIVLADEINRAPPRTQSGLLEAMQEGAVTIDDRTYELPQPFIVLATQNPLEHHGTYPLPESQLDRFLMRLTIGYPDETWERRILEESSSPADPMDALDPMFDPDTVLALQSRVGKVATDPDLMDYAMAIVRATREDDRVRLGVSPRGAIGLLRAARAYALVDGRDFLAPDDIRRVVEPCLAHRIIPAGGTAAGDAYEEVRVILEDILDAVPAPL
jgi:MoxR-like ATPase